MSVHWTIFCETHVVWGPDIRRSAEGVPRLVGYWPRRHGEPPQTAPDEAWDEFMREHEWCDLRLVHE